MVVHSRNRSLSMFDSFLTPLVLMHVEKGVQLEVKEKMSLGAQQQRDKASETGMPSRNQLWLPEQMLLYSRGGIYKSDYRDYYFNNTLQCSFISCQPRPEWERAASIGALGFLSIVSCVWNFV